MTVRIKGIARSCRRARVVCARREGLEVLRNHGRTSEARGARRARS